MMDFACKQIQFDELVRCSFTLTKTDYKILMFLIEQSDNFGVQDLAYTLKLDRTTVQKSVKKLYEKKLVVKHQTNFTSGGYAFVYSINHKEDIKKRILEIIDKWSVSVKEYVSKW